ncbi:Rieske 2Fe-2S domain-containing protein [Azospirillum formosense]|uniref:Rieske 2Fe-2S domain-containing protein n=1 Tax=Azospirillum formosense TaxID=861533 RepID=A0ABX2L5P7_9PROT|nr:SRPBCC family protein [Azospirillum formosense]MBY3755665.1 Rieske 2Fe-2S domain-containing protein [Azospirillum formosense]NUB21466.1 Rieske 2Fe-2S domain-containing protein [Azospirillum formosense]
MDDRGQQSRLSFPPDMVIPPQRYSGEANHAEEAARVFRRCWMFVGFTDDLRNDNDFITADIAGTSVLVQNFDGELRAYHNVCTHRYSLIHLRPCGNGKPVCPYHGWVFNRDGVPVGIPGNREHFGLDDAAKKRLALRRFEVAVRGRFVFVRLEPVGPGLDEQLGAYGAVLDHLSDLFTDRIDEGVLPWSANWKAALESALEVYHVDATHPETFKGYVKKVWICSYEGEHSRGVSQLSDGSARWWDGVSQKMGLPRSDRLESYDHYLIFPNLAIGVSHGALMSVQTYDPVGPDRCELHYRLFLGETSKPQTKGGAARKAVEANVAGFNRTILGEDQRVAEATHKGLKQVQAPAVLGSCEERIAAFHRAWLARMAAE